MIPKIIHYCWFGGAKKSKLIRKCMASWKKFCPDYVIVEHNESDFDPGFCRYTRRAYDNGAYAFVSDVARLKAVCDSGGIYLDTDVELVAPLDRFLNDGCFFAFEKSNYVATGLIFGAEPGNRFVKANLDRYTQMDFRGPDGTGSTVACPTITTDLFETMGLCRKDEFQRLDGAVFYPSPYFDPYNHTTGVMRRTPDTCSIHWYGMSWLSPVKILRTRLARPFHRIFGNDCFSKLKRGK